MFTSLCFGITVEKIKVLAAVSTLDLHVHHAQLTCEYRGDWTLSVTFWSGMTTCDNFQIICTVFQTVAPSCKKASV